MTAAGERRKQVRLGTFANEPMARLAEQRLREQGIPCLAKSLGGGPGLWGSSFNLPHEVLVYESDAARARELLELPPLEPTGRRSGGEAGPKPPVDRRLLAAGVIIIILAVVLALRF